MRVTKRKNQNIIVCPKNRQFTDLVVCAASCDRKTTCSEYIDKINLEILQQYILEHPEYEIKGEIMATKKTADKKKMLWVIDAEQKVKEVTEEEIMNNPIEYKDVEIWDKPPYKYEVVVTLKRKRA